VITEAMECGLPTVAMDCPCGPCEIVTKETGIVVQDKNIVAFSAALQKLMDSPTLRIQMGKAAAKDVERFYPDNIMQQWIKIFENKKQIISAS
jgi:glycosyltransferase involved in cell wall biosynthesis